MLESQASVGQALIDGMIAREDAAWRKFLHDVGPLLKGLCRRAGLGEDEAKDIGQAVALKLLEGDCRALRGLKVTEQSFYWWAKVVISRTVIDHIKSRGVRQHREWKAVREGGTAGRSESAAESIELRVTLDGVVGELSPLDQTFFWLDYWGLKDAEIARMTGVGLTAAQKRLSRLRERLRKLLTEHELGPSDREKSTGD